MNEFDDNKSKKQLFLKAGMFGLLAVLTGTWSVVSPVIWYSVVMLLICVWSSCRLYNCIIIYVLEQNVEGEQKPSIMNMLIEGVKKNFNLSERASDLVDKGDLAMAAAAMLIPPPHQIPLQSTDYQIRRLDRAGSRNDAMALLAEGVYGILATADAAGNPYCVPVNYVLDMEIDDDETSCVGEFGNKGGNGCDGGNDSNGETDSGVKKVRERIIIHCASSGHKLDNIHQNSKVCFCVVGPTEVVPEKFTSRYVSAVAFGTCVELESPDEKALGLRKLCEKYCPGMEEASEEMIQQQLERTTVLAMSIDHLTAKANRNV